ncbi:hypothetical protein PHYBLDRAFT_69797 [Phycomyces blakesleeanus NRRL 1555(-)]|uniref:Tc1-like transposase DDE domain-containing protein n=1 Tax=Phycomyces blakesleeanus (strain ATCC 8743b / DSM 1359 / FGSC 10004 / NBRC 33097 / NRRL 1555) TaxID=763407 RepID=A0A167PNN1_PHYB8|nr:hypothetical protein PHYBLDRAFT_69797 [Phycomyces blakesleeanus NRRL 1555(-)]OAD78266.1 hypothetical protein PHYBLDRAFT_69797 [Phycomyces blakesleeanus NRRL 1555(-)]|eukprot:XP_018296306.1 hypothetical protein PHYBLDRAFT_69797 [Phycomyces blakesleeanus NRRL 1555(-)]
MKVHYFAGYNSSIQTLGNIAKYVEFRGNRCVVLAPYSSGLNQIEKSWSVAKSKRHGSKSTVLVETTTVTVEFSSFTTTGSRQVSFSRFMVIALFSALFVNGGVLKKKVYSIDDTSSIIRQELIKNTFSRVSVVAHQLKIHVFIKDVVKIPKTEGIQRQSPRSRLKGVGPEPVILRHGYPTDAVATGMIYCKIDIIDEYI